MSEVPFTAENMANCICERCPVQIRSQCVKGKIEQMKKMTGMLNQINVPNPKDVPLLYCAGGKAACKDIDMRQMCICENCPVWSEYNLSDGFPPLYYCRDGAVE